MVGQMGVVEGMVGYGEDCGGSERNDRGRGCSCMVRGVKEMNGYGSGSTGMVGEFRRCSGMVREGGWSKVNDGDRGNNGEDYQAWRRRWTGMIARRRE